MLTKSPNETWRASELPTLLTVLASQKLAAFVFRLPLNMGKVGKGSLSADNNHTN